MKRLKITESQATLLKKLGAKRKTLKLTSGQFNRLCEVKTGSDAVVANFKKNASSFGVPPYKFKEGVEPTVDANELKREILSVLKNALSGAEVIEISPTLKSIGISHKDIENIADDEFINSPVEGKKRAIDEFISELYNTNEVTSAAGGASGAYVGLLSPSDDDEVKLNRPSVAIGGIISDSEEEFSEEDVMESAGEYDAPGFAPTKKGTKVGPYVQNIDVYQTNKLAKNEGADNVTNLKSTAWPDGEFVDFDDCVKLNNNKVAQNGGCNTGDSGVVKLTKTPKSIISNQKG
tara:strand:- start:1429 stop:2304 length:876 start_codon:yes stop_codon:yes gene_type:complete